MLRRKFIGLLPVIGAGTLSPVAFLKADNRADDGSASRHRAVTVTYKVQGFTCITCAIGLETLLGREKGILSVKASYADATAVIEFDPNLISEASVKEAIQSSGFIAHTIVTGKLQS